MIELIVAGWVALTGLFGVASQSSEVPTDGAVDPETGGDIGDGDPYP